MTFPIYLKTSSDINSDVNKVCRCEYSVNVLYQYQHQYQHQYQYQYQYQYHTIHLTIVH